MKHRIGFNALSRKSSQRKALMRSMVTSLLRYERIETTKAKALEVRKMAEKLITRGKTDSVHNRRVAARYIYDETVVSRKSDLSSQREMADIPAYSRLETDLAMQLRWSYSSLSRRQRRKRKLQRRLTRKPTRPKQSKAMLQ